MHLAAHSIPKFLSSPSHVFHFHNLHTTNAIFPKKSWHDYPVPFATLKESSKKLSSPASLPQTSNPLHPCQILAKESLRTYLCHFDRIEIELKFTPTP